MANCKSKNNNAFLFFIVGVILQQSAINGIFSLVSSLNVEEGLGTTSLAVGYGVSLVVSFFIPGLIQVLGSKRFFIILYACFLPFILGNLYTSYYTLIPGSCFLGIGEAGFWACSSVITIHFATKSVNGKLRIHKIRSTLTGLFFAAVQSGVVFGNGIGYIFLAVDKAVSLAWHNTTHTPDYSICAANDCQDENVTSINMKQYIPTYQATLSGLICFLAAILVLATILEFMYLPNNIDCFPTNTLHTSKESIVLDRDNTELDEVQQQTMRQIYSEENRQVSSTQQAANKESEAMNTSIGKRLMTSLSLFLIFFIKREHLLVMLLPLYNGMLIGFVYGELTRAFGACILGIDKVSAGVILFGITDSIFSYISGKVAGKWGRNFPYAFAFLVDILTYTLCLKWKITANTTWITYILFLLFGISDGIWQALINDMYGNFVNEENVSFSVWGFLVTLGVTIQFSISKLFCVYIKIYIQFALLCSAFFLYGVAYCKYDIYKAKDPNKAHHHHSEVEVASQ